MARLVLEIVTPERKVLSQEVDEVTLPGAHGELGVLQGHTELVTLLRPGRLEYRDGSNRGVFAIGGGFAEIGHEKVILLADAAESAEEIDVKRAEEAKRRAEQRIEELEVADETWAAAYASLERAIVRIDIGK